MSNQAVSSLLPASLTARCCAALALGVAVFGALAGCQAPPAAVPPGDAADESPSLQLAAEVMAAADTIDEDYLRGIVERLSSDDFEGRGPATRGDEMTQQYLASELEALGYEPGGPGGDWLQPVGIVSLTTKAPETWSFRSPGGSAELAYWDDFIVASGVQAETATVDDAEVVFVGYGIRAPEYGWDDYKGMDVAGKVLLMMNNDPDWDPELFSGNRRLYYGRWDYKYEIAAELGAAGAIIIHTTPSAGYPYQVVQTSWTGPQFELPAAGEPRTQIESWVTEEAAGRLAALGGRDLGELVAAAKGRDFQPVPLGLTTSIRIDNEVSNATTANVAGLLRGSDAALADEVVVYTAHHDHLGVGQPDDSGDAIYNGALDNASGVAQVMAVARAIASLPTRPRRSTLILFVAAEEQGLIGSAYYARNPTFAAGKIAANINLDGGNIWGRTRDLTYIGYGKSSLDGVVEAAAAHQGRSCPGRPVPGSRFLLPIGSVQLRQDRRARHLPRFRHRLRRPPHRLGPGTDGSVGGREVPPAGRRARRELDLRGDARKRPAGLLLRHDDRPVRRDAGLEPRRRVRGGAVGGLGAGSLSPCWRATRRAGRALRRSAAGWRCACNRRRPRFCFSATSSITGVKSVPLCEPSQYG